MIIQFDTVYLSLKQEQKKVLNFNVKVVARTFLFKRTSFRPPIGAKSGSKSPCDPRHHPGVISDQPSMVLVSKTGEMWNQLTKNLKIKKKILVPVLKH